MCHIKIRETSKTCLLAPSAIQPYYGIMGKDDVKRFNCVEIEKFDFVTIIFSAVVIHLMIDIAYAPT